MEYSIVSAATDKELIEKVNDLFSQGWETEGGVSISPDGTFYQAMIMFDDEGDEFETGQEL